MRRYKFVNNEHLRGPTLRRVRPLEHWIDPGNVSGPAHGRCQLSGREFNYVPSDSPVRHVT